MTGNTRLFHDQVAPLVDRVVAVNPAQFQVITTKTFIVSPFNGHYRPPEHYLCEADRSSKITWVQCNPAHMSKPVMCMGNDRSAVSRGRKRTCGS